MTKIRGERRAYGRKKDVEMSGKDKMFPHICVDENSERKGYSFCCQTAELRKKRRQNQSDMEREESSTIHR